VTAGDPAETAVIVGEAIGLIGAVRPATGIITGMVADAEARLRNGATLIADD
jgi:hypothetical protein